MEPRTRSQRTRTAALAVAIVLGVAFAMLVQAGPQPKIEICHFPPGNPANFHTITINQNAWPAHQDNHGDLLGSCLDNCESICGDGDACTQDVESDPDACICLYDHPPVDCNDGLACTDDSCDPNDGCQNVNNCFDGNQCTADMCLSTGDCAYPDASDGTFCDYGENATAGSCQDGECEETVECIEGLC
jgi:hypothetical protein